jgi:predicted ATPase
VRPLEREKQLNALNEWLRDAESGSGRIIFLGGEERVGKTSLVEHFSYQILSRARVVRGACDSHSTPHPLAPLHDIANDVGGQLEVLLTQAAPRDHVFRAASTELIAGPLPSVVTVEDAHWADEATFDLLRYLGRRRIRRALRVRSPQTLQMALDMAENAVLQKRL